MSLSLGLQKDDVNPRLSEKISFTSVTTAKFDLPKILYQLIQILHFILYSIHDRFSLLALGYLPILLLLLLLLNIILL